MKIALVHDYIKEFGGAERVLMTLHEMFPEAPIYTAFVAEGSAKKEFEKVGAKLIPSWANILLKYKNAHSAFRFLIPFVWESFNFSKYDIVILSSSGYLTKPIRIPKHVKVICYCHTPSRFLYGYETSIEWKKYPIVKIYGYLIGHFLRLYDWLGSQRIDQFIANSNNVARRIKKFYRKEAMVIYPPVEVKKIIDSGPGQNDGGFFLVASRLVGEKGLPMVMDAANKLKIKLKVVGEKAGLQWENEKIEKRKSNNIEFLGRVSDEELYKLYATCKAFIVLEKDVDFGITPVEAMAAGTPVIAYKNGGYLETVTSKTGVFFDELSVESLINAVKKFNSLKFKVEDCQNQAKKFSKEIFVKKMKEIIYA